MCKGDSGFRYSIKPSLRHLQITNSIRSQNCTFTCHDLRLCLRILFVLKPSRAGNSRILRLPLPQGASQLPRNRFLAFAFSNTDQTPCVQRPQENYDVGPEFGVLGVQWFVPVTVLIAGVGSLDLER